MLTYHLLPELTESRLYKTGHVRKCLIRHLILNRTLNPYRGGAALTIPDQLLPIGKRTTKL